MRRPPAVETAFVGRCAKRMPRGQQGSAWGVSGGPQAVGGTLSRAPGRAARWLEPAATRFRKSTADSRASVPGQTDAGGGPAAAQAKSRDVGSLLRRRARPDQTDRAATVRSPPDRRWHGVPMRTRTSNLWLRRPTLYPIELWGLRFRGFYAPFRPCQGSPEAVNRRRPPGVPAIVRLRPGVQGLRRGTYERGAGRGARWPTGPSLSGPGRRSRPRSAPEGGTVCGRSPPCRPRSPPARCPRPRSPSRKWPAPRG